RQQRVAGRHDPDGPSQFVGGCVLQQEAAGSSTQRFVDVVVQVEGGQHDDLRVTQSRCTKYSAGRFQPVDLRHADIHQHDVRAQLPYGVRHVRSVGRVTDDVDVRLRGQQGA